MLEKNDAVRGLMSIDWVALLQSAVAGLAGANAPDLVQVGHKYFAVTDLAGFRTLDDGFDGAFDEVIGHGDLNLRLRQEIDHVLGAAIQFSMATLPAEPFDFADCHALNTDLAQCVANVVEAKRFNDGGDKLHS